MLDVASYACAFISLHALCLKQFQSVTFVLTSNSGFKGRWSRFFYDQARFYASYSRSGAQGLRPSSLIANSPCEFSVL
jgi:hypothetical protein